MRVLGLASSRAEKILDWRRGGLTYAATCSAVRGGPSYCCGLISASGVEGRAGLVTPAMKRSTMGGEGVCFVAKCEFARGNRGGDLGDGLEFSGERVRKNKVIRLMRQAKELGFGLVPLEQAA